MIYYILFLWLVLAGPFKAEEIPWPEGTEILAAVDRNLAAETRIMRARMLIVTARGNRAVEFRSYIRGEDQAYTEYLAPPREKGVKMLKLHTQLWTYMPDANRVIQIAGHLLRQSVMGSDLSYEDMLEDNRLADSYTAEVTAIDTLAGRSCWVLRLDAARDGLTYQQRKLWVDCERWTPLREELYSKSGRLIKEIELNDVRYVDNRWFPHRMLFRDLLKKSGGTEFIIDSIRFNPVIPPYFFTKSVLR